MEHPAEEHVGSVGREAERGPVQLGWKVLEPTEAGFLRGISDTPRVGINSVFDVAAALADVRLRRVLVTAAPDRVRMVIAGGDPTVGLFQASRW